jgi:hypothetical protein
MAIEVISQHSVSMLLRIAIVGGLTLMTGQHTRSESLFYYLRLDDQVAETHLLVLVDQHINFGFVREQLQESYSDTGRPSIDPELLLRILLNRYLPLYRSRQGRHRLTQPRVKIHTARTRRLLFQPPTPEGSSWSQGSAACLN